MNFDVDRVSQLSRRHFFYRYGRSNKKKHYGTALGQKIKISIVKWRRGYYYSLIYYLRGIDTTQLKYYQIGYFKRYSS